MAPHFAYISVQCEQYFCTEVSYGFKCTLCDVPCVISACSCTFNFETVLLMASQKTSSFHFDTDCIARLIFLYEIRN